jgi:hypothetical protein
MKPLTKFYTIILSITTLAVFTIWSQSIKLMEISDFYKVILGSLISIGVYRFFVAFTISLSKKIKSLRRFILGPYYLEGTWIGFYIGAEGKVRYIVEKFEQELDSLTIRGEYYNELSKHHSMMTATNVNINAEMGEISYMYKCHPINDQSPHEGLAIFNIHRDDQYSPATKLVGYSAELHIGKRIKTIESKISSKTSIELNDALTMAKNFYEQNKNNF